MQYWQTDYSTINTYKQYMKPC